MVKSEASKHIEDIRINIKFCCKLGIRAADTFKMIQSAYGAKAMSRKNVFKWHSRFRQGRDSIADDRRNGSACRIRTKENIERVREIIKKQPDCSLRTIGRRTGIAKSTVHSIIKQNLGCEKVNVDFYETNYIEPEVKNEPLEPE